MKLFNYFYDKFSANFYRSYLVFIMSLDYFLTLIFLTSEIIKAAYFKESCIVFKAVLKLIELTCSM